MADLKILALRHRAVKKVAESAKKELDGLREEIFTELEASGTPDDKGNITIRVSDQDKDIVIKKERRVSVKLDEDAALVMFKDKKLIECVAQIEVVHEGALEKAVLDGKVTQDELGAVTIVKESFALKIK